MLPEILGVLVAVAPPAAEAATPPTWTNKEVLVAIGSVLGTLIPIIWGIMKLLMARLRARVKKLERDLEVAKLGRPSSENIEALNEQLADAKGQVIALEKSEKEKIEQLEKQKVGFEEQEKRYLEAVAALDANLKAKHVQVEELEGSLKAECRRIERALDRDGQTWTARVFATAPEFKPLDPEGRHTPIVSVLNLKGGVGKTTTTANLAAALDGMGYRVLLIDLDLQGSLSNLFLDPKQQDEIQKQGRTLEDFLFASFDAEFPALPDYIQPILQRSGIVTTSDLLAYAETNLTIRWVLREGTRRDVRFLLRKGLHLKKVTNNYDIILLDCPPLINVSCVNALAASDYLLIPVMPSRQTTVRVPILLKRLKEFCDNINPSLRILGILPSRTFSSELTYEEDNRMSELLGHCKDTWGTSVHRFNAIIRQSKDFRVAEDERRPLQAGEEVHDAFRSLACEIETCLPDFCRPPVIDAPSQEANA